MLCGLRHYTMLKRPEIYSWHIFVKKDIGGLSICTLCYENYDVQGITLCCTGMGRDRAASIYSVWSARPPLCSYARPVSERWLNSSYMSAQFSSLCPSHVHRRLNSGYMPALQSAPRLNCVASLCSLNCAGQATGSKGRAGGGHSFSV